MKTARAVVIDENPKEALYLIEALSSAGVGCVYVSGENPDLFPKPKLEGVRVVFLDLNLIGQTEARLYLPHAVHVLKECVALKPRSTGIICWTSHEDELAQLESVLKEQGVEPSFLLTLREKLQLLNQGADGASSVIAQLRSHFESLPGHRLLVDWEQISHSAITHATQRLVEISKDDADLLKLLAAIAKAAADEPSQSDEQSLLNLFSGLSAIYHDSIEELVELGVSGVSGVEVHQRTAQLRDEPPTPTQQARINGILLSNSSDRHGPGNVYLLPSFDLSGTVTDDKEIRRFINEVFFSKRSKDDPDWWKKFVGAVEKASRICGVEITPPCDHAQKKAKSARIILGLLVSLDDDTFDRRDLVIPVESRSFAKEIEPLYVASDMDNLRGTVKLVVNARYLQTEALERIQTKPALFRFRPAVVADIQAWFASHAARPGYVSLR